MHVLNLPASVKKYGTRGSALFAILAAGLILAACPLPYEFSGGNGAGALSRDPSSPDVTPPVTFSYQQVGGSGGTVENGSTTISTSNDTTITLTTSMPNATIFFTDDGTPLTSLSGAQSFSGSSGQLVLRIENPSPTNRIREKQIRAVAVAPGMRPSPLRELIATVTYFFTPRATVTSVPITPSTVTQTSRRVVLRVLRMEVEIDQLRLDAISSVLGGSHAATDIRRLEMWRGTSSTFNDDATLVGSLFRDAGVAPGEAVNIIPSGLNGRFDPGVHYLFLTATIDSAATLGAEVFAAGMPLPNLADFGEHELSGSDPLSPGPQRTIAAGTNPFAMNPVHTIHQRRFELSNVRINNTQAVEATVPAGTPVTVQFDLSSSQAGDFCPGCVVQAYVGVRAVAATCAVSFTGFNASVENAAFTFTPPQPGLYYVSMGASLDFNCLDNPERRVAYFDLGRNSALIVAQ